MNPKTYKLSPHTLNLYAECKPCFWNSLHEHKRPSGPFPSLPSGMDRIIKQRFDNYREKGQLPEELSEIESVTLFSDKEKLSLWRNQKQGLQWSDPAGNILAGSLDDLLIQTKDNKLVVLDYKTRGFPLKETPAYYNLQMEIYSFLLQQNGYDTAEHALLLFYYPKQFSENGLVEFNTKIVKVDLVPAHAEKTFREALQLINEKKPELNPECDFCQW